MMGHSFDFLSVALHSYLINCNEDSHLDGDTRDEDCQQVEVLPAAFIINCDIGVVVSNGLLSRTRLSDTLTCFHGNHLVTQTLTPTCWWLKIWCQFFGRYLLAPPLRSLRRWQLTHRAKELPPEFLTDLSLNFSTQENFNNIQPLSNFAYLIFVTTGGCVTFVSWV